MPCESNKYVGREALLEFVIDCGDTMPEANAWRLFGAGRTKEFTLTWDTADSTADDVEGAIRSNLATWLNFELSADGVNRKADTADSNQTELMKHFVNPIETGGQPIILIRLTMPDVTIISAMLMSEFSRSFPYDDVATWSISMAVTGSAIGLTVTDTPVVPDGPAVETVTVTPPTATIAVGDTEQLTGAVAPGGAPTALTWNSSNAAVATVSSTGLVTAVAEGSATIVATSTSDPSKIGTAAITVDNP